jgi:hypothetical protein
MEMAQPPDQQPVRSGDSAKVSRALPHSLLSRAPFGVPSGNLALKEDPNPTPELSAAIVSPCSSTM